MESGVLYECGEYTVTMTATDEHGNSSSCDFSLTVRDCDACCLSEEAFMDLTDQGFEVEAMLENGINCIVQIYPPTLTDCQIITQFQWGDGTVMNGQFPSDIDFTHEYSDIGVYDVCITMEETDTGECFFNQVCQEIEVTSECSVITSVQDIASVSEVLLFPNPTTGILNVVASYEINSVQLYNTKGQFVPVNFQDDYLDISSVLPGVYMVRIEIDNHFFYRKIIKI